MIESELFGHLKGAFTGAETAREGLFAHAHGGTLFLDEVGDLQLATQGKLLRAIEARRIRPVGSERETPVDIRFIFATNADLEEKIADGCFRTDLYYRINVMQIAMPALRERIQDIAELARLFMHRLSKRLRMAKIPITASVQAGLEKYHWPGNVRELRNLIERALTLGHFPDAFCDESARANDESTSLASMERRYILKVLAETAGNRAEAARRLGISRKTIDRKCAAWNV
jgi:transcriptional regulator with PAS, ATPase and Fis domain